MTDIGFEPDRVRKWMATPIGGKVALDNPALTRMADVVLEAMTAAGGNDPDLQLMVLTKVQAMIVAGVLRDASEDEASALLSRVGLETGMEALAFLRAMKRDMRKAS